MANANVGSAFITIIPTTKGAQKEIAGQIVPAAGKAGTSAGSVMGGNISKALGKVAVPAAAFAGIAALGKKSYEAFKLVEEGANNVIKATGATGEKAEQLTDVYKNVAKNVVGDFGDIGAAVGELNTRLGLEGDALEAASEEMMKYAKVTGQDATAATKDVASMMRNAGIPTEQMADVLGKLTVAGQAAGIDVAKLAQNTTKYNAVMKQLGLSTDEQIALMAKFEQSGADTASILNAMKKGVATWAKEGKDAKVEFENFVKGVQNGSVTAGDAVEIFGSRGGLSMYEAAQKGQLSFQEMFDTITAASADNLDQVYKDTLTASEKIDLVMQNINLGLAEAAAPAVEEFGKIIETIVLPAVQALSDHAEIAVPALMGIGTALVLIKGASVVSSGLQAVSGAMTSIASKGAATAGSLAATAAGETAAGTAATASAGQILAAAVAVVALGGAVWLAGQGLSTMADAAIRLAAAGAPAVAIMGGMVGVVAGPAVGAAALGPALTAGSVGMVAFGAAVLMVGAGIGIATAGVALLAQQLPTIVQYGGQAAPLLAQIGGSVVLLGGASVVAAAGIGTLAAACLAAAGGLGGMTVALGAATVAMGAFGFALGDIPNRMYTLGKGSVTAANGLRMLPSQLAATSAGLAVMGRGINTVTRALKTLQSSSSSAMGQLSRSTNSALSKLSQPYS